MIVLIGRAGAGKDTTYGIIKKLDPSFERVAFGDPLKDIIATGFGITRELVDALKRDTKGKFKYVTPIQNLCTGVNMRTLMARIGTDTREKGILPENIWVNIAITKANDFFGKGNDVVVTDARFINEVEQLKKFFAITTVKIINNSVPLLAHRSETELDEYKADIEIDNNGTVEELEENVKIFLDKYKKERREAW